MSDIQTGTDTSSEGGAYVAYDLTDRGCQVGGHTLSSEWLTNNKRQFTKVAADLTQYVDTRPYPAALIDLERVSDLIVRIGGECFERQTVIDVFYAGFDGFARRDAAIPTQADPSGGEQTSEAGEVTKTEAVPAEVETGPMGGWFYALLMVLSVPYLLLFGVTLQAMHFLCAPVYTVKDLDLAIVFGSLPVSIRVALFFSGVNLNHLRLDDLGRPRTVINIVVCLFGTLFGLCLLSAICG